jgi:hypothetical protein
LKVPYLLQRGDPLSSGRETARHLKYVRQHLQQLANMIAIRHLLYAVAHVAPPVNGRHILVAIIDVRLKLRLLLHAAQS